MQKHCQKKYSLIIFIKLNWNLLINYINLVKFINNCFHQVSALSIQLKQYLWLNQLKLIYNININTPLTNRAMMCPFRFNTATLGTLKDHLPFPKTHLLNHLFGGIPFRHGALQTHQLKKKKTKHQIQTNTLTGSVNIVRRCEAKARKAHIWNRAMLITL